LSDKRTNLRGVAGRFIARRLLRIVAACLAWLVLLWAPTTQPFVEAIPSLSRIVDPAALERQVRALSETFHPRSFDRKDKLDAAAAYIVGEFAGIGLAAEFQRVEVDGEAYRNVVVRIPDSANSYSANVSWSALTTIHTGMATAATATPRVTTTMPAVSRG
jgi:hypothetical protein